MKVNIQPGYVKTVDDINDDERDFLILSRTYTRPICVTFETHSEALRLKNESETLSTFVAVPLGKNSHVRKKQLKKQCKFTQLPVP